MTAAPIPFRVIMGCLRPADDDAQTAVAALTHGSTVSVVIKRTSRSSKRNRLYRGMLHAATRVLAEQVPGLTADDLHVDLKEQLGLGTWLTFPSGRKRFQPASTSFHKMTEPTFAAYVTRVDAVLCCWLGCPPGSVFEEAKARIAESDAA